MGITTDKLKVEDISKGADSKGYSPDIVDVDAFYDRVLAGYNEGWGDAQLPADIQIARSIMPAGTAAKRDFSFLAPEIPVYNSEKCVGCMSCVIECPDTAILGKVIKVDQLAESLDAVEDDDQARLFKGPIC